jgi:hypothetical protein
VNGDCAKRFVSGKRGNADLCEDLLVETPRFIGVIDSSSGVTTRSEQNELRETVGQLIGIELLCVFESADKGLDVHDIVKCCGSGQSTPENSRYAMTSSQEKPCRPARNRTSAGLEAPRRPGVAAATRDGTRRLTERLSNTPQLLMRREIRLVPIDSHGPA